MSRQNNSGPKKGNDRAKSRPPKSNSSRSGASKSNASAPGSARSGYPKSGPIKNTFKKPHKKRTPQPQLEVTKEQQPKTKGNVVGASSSVRLNRFIANSGICSRREADNLIAAGLVEVNGKVVQEMGYKVAGADRVKFNGSEIRREQKVYYVLNKPKGFITTTNDPKARKTVMDLMGQAGSERIYPVGRLDRQTSGVLLFTNDGDFAKRLTHPSHGARKVYDVSLDKNLDRKHFNEIEKGLQLSDGPIQVDEIAYIEGKDRSHIGIVVHSGRNRIVRRIFDHLGYNVIKLDRTVFAGVTKKNLRRGQWRKMEEKEVETLMMR
jgi:23S rRNA pseudouridine2605 synthase